jgi:serine protease AprX
MTRPHTARQATTTVLVAAALVTVGSLVTPAAPAQAGTLWRVDVPSGTGMASAMAAIDADGTGLTGRGIGVAMVDTGVAPVPGLTGGNVVNGPDLSFDSQDASTRYVDRDGHGTHLAGIMVGRKTGAFDGGIAPDAKLTSVKVGSGTGVVDVSQVIAAIDWVVAHRHDDKANKTRVLELSYGTDAVQSVSVDPLAHAVQSAWRAGIVVVTAGGNAGGNTRLLDPATDPYVISVGSLDTQGTVAESDDRVSDFTSRGAAARRLDVVVPGRSIVSLRAPGSAADSGYPAARVGTNAFKGSGSSQATALVAGAVALLLEKRPGLTPDQVKALILRNSRAVTPAGSADYGLRVMDLARTIADTGATKAQTWAKSTGIGTLEGSRGSVHISDGTKELRGESDIFGPLNTTSWATAATNTWAWNADGRWMGRVMAGAGYDTDTTGLRSWSGRAWSGRAWSGRAWSGATWSSITWNGNVWSVAGWH